MPGGTWQYRDPGRLVGARIGAPEARTVLVPPGIPQQTLLDDALRSVRDGELDVALVVGGEAARRAVMARRAGVEITDTVQDESVEPDELRLPSREIITQARDRGRLRVGAGAVRLIDSALRGAEGRSIDEHRDEIARCGAASARSRRLPARRVPDAADAERSSAIRAPTTGRWRSPTTSGTARR